MNHPKLKAIEKKPARIGKSQTWRVMGLYNLAAAERQLGKRMSAEGLIDYLLAVYVHASKANKAAKKESK
jgi:hypothetical protein